MRVVYYSLAVASADTRYERQWIRSVRSLRAFNGSIAVWLLMFGEPSSELLEEAGRLNVWVCGLGAYWTCFRSVPQSWAEALVQLPTLHKFISLGRCPTDGITQALYLDCDTYFFGDVELLFERYRTCHWYAREEPNSSRSHHGYDPAYVDEGLLYAISRSEGLAPIPPYNTGVCMLNHGIWQVMRGLERDFLAYVWRLLMGMRFLPSRDASLDGGLANVIERNATAFDRGFGLPYPSSNAWIVEEIALWLTLGKLAGLSHDVLRREDVAQDGERALAARDSPAPVLAHYYSGLEAWFLSTLDAMTAPSTRRRRAHEPFARPEISP